MNTARMRPTAVSDHSIPSPELGAQKTCMGLGLRHSHYDPLQAPLFLASSSEMPSFPKAPHPDPQEGGIISLSPPQKGTMGVPPSCPVAPAYPAEGPTAPPSI